MPAIARTGRAIALLLGAALPCVLLAGHAPRALAQNLMPDAPVAAGMQQAQAMLDRMVRVVGRQVAGGTGVEGYGFIVGTHPMADGKPGLLIALPDHVVRDPTAPGAAFAPPRVIFFANLAQGVAGEVLAMRLPPEQGDLAMIVAPGRASGAFPSVGVADPRALLPGASAWQVGRPEGWQPSPRPGRFDGREDSGWLRFEGLDLGAGGAGGAVLTGQGLAGMLVSEQAGGAAHVLPVDLMAAKIRGWGLIWDFPPAHAAPTPQGAAASLAMLTMPEGTRGGAGAVAGMPGAAPAPAAPEAAAIPAIRPGPVPDRMLALAPVPVVPMSSAELAARASWAPAGARLSPLAAGAAPLFALPRKDSQIVGALPPGTQLPQLVWSRGAYELQRRLDGGAWFLVGSEGQPIGYAQGGMLVELWPSLPAQAPPAGKLVRDWGMPGDAHATLRDAGTHYELSATVICQRASCNSVLVYTPPPPAPGAVLPTLRIMTIEGNWPQNAAIPVHLQLPRGVVDSSGTKLLACVGRDTDCDAQPLLPPPG